MKILDISNQFAMKRPKSFENNYRYACKADRLKPWIKIQDSRAPLQQNNQHPLRRKWICFENPVLLTLSQNLGVASPSEQNNQNPFRKFLIPFENLMVGALNQVCQLRAPVQQNNQSLLRKLQMCWENLIRFGDLSENLGFASPLQQHVQNRVRQKYRCSWKS